MSPVIMDMPPAAIGHNSQACEVRPAANASRIKEAKAAYLRMALQAGVSERDRILHYAAITMDSAEFHAFYLAMHHGTRHGDRVLVGQQRLADLMGCSDRHIRRIMAELDGKWFPLRGKQRDARKGIIPDAIMQSLTAELIGQPKNAGQHIVVPAAMFPQHVEQASVPSRTDMSGSDATSRTPVSGSNDISSRTPTSYSESRAGHFRPNEPDIPVRITIEDKPNTPESAPARIRARVDPPSWAMNATLSPDERKAQSRIWRIEGGGLAISEDLRAELARDFPLVPIDETLRIVKTESGIKDTAVHLLSQVERKFAYAQRDEAGRERRYQQRASEAIARAAPPSGRQQNWRPSTPEDACKAIMREVRARNAAGGGA
jgi:hypothetical protein